jgi:hypothetical protein
MKEQEEHVADAFVSERKKRKEQKKGEKKREKLKMDGKKQWRKRKLIEEEEEEDWRFLQKERKKGMMEKGRTEYLPVHHDHHALPEEETLISLTKIKIDKMNPCKLVGVWWMCFCVLLKVGITGHVHFFDSGNISLKN